MPHAHQPTQKLKRPEGMELERVARCTNVLGLKARPIWKERLVVKSETGEPLIHIRWEPTEKLTLEMAAARTRASSTVYAAWNSGWGKALLRWQTRASRRGNPTERALGRRTNMCISSTWGER